VNPPGGRASRVAAFAALVAVFALADEANAREPADVLREQDRIIARRTALMSALTGWAGASIAGGTLLLITDPFAQPPVSNDRDRKAFRRAFGAITLAYGLVNMALGVGALASNGHHRETLRSHAEIMGARHRTATIFSANVGLDMIYMATGATLWAYGPSASARGLGAGFLTQGGFLLAFDAVGATLSRH
jgi:hypothetical protein